MECKDDRSKAKRNKMRNYYQRRGTAPTGGNTSSSSNPVEPAVRGIVDVADSSDDRFCYRGGWGASGKVPSQQMKRGNAPLDLMNYPDYDLNDVENAQMRAGDYQQMSQMPLSQGGHFQFSSEKQWDTIEGENMLENTEASEYFTLNLKLLNAGLLTIPFHKRMDYPSSMFTVEQLASMEKAAEVGEKNYQNVLREHETNPRIKINSASQKSNATTTRQNSARSAATPATNPEATGDELDELLNMTTTQVNKLSLDVKQNENTGSEVVTTPNANTANVAGGGENKDDIQQWLDNVLEE